MNPTRRIVLSTALVLPLSPSVNALVEVLPVDRPDAGRIDAGRIDVSRLPIYVWHLGVGGKLAGTARQVWSTFEDETSPLFFLRRQGFDFPQWSGIHYGIVHPYPEDSRRLTDEIRRVLDYSLNHANPDLAYPPAGPTRGTISIPVAGIPRAVRDVIYARGINPLGHIPNVGPCIWGQKFITRDGQIARMTGDPKWGYAGELNPEHHLPNGLHPNLVDLV